MFRLIANLIIRSAQRRPYRKGHLLHADGSLYMGRWALFETKWLSARVHNIASPDSDRHLHDHPWAFVSVVLRGWYLEKRPVMIEPSFPANPHGAFSAEYCEEEVGNYSYRRAGSIAFRRATDRHAIVEAAKDANLWTLFIYGPAVQWWGFYTPAGKVHFLDYAKQSDAPISAVIQAKDVQA